MSASEHRPPVFLALDISQSDEAIGCLVSLCSDRVSPKDRLAFLRWCRKSAQLPLLTIIR